MKLKKGDWAVLFLALSLITATAIPVYRRSGSEAHLVLEAPDLTEVYSLSVSREIRVPGPLGETVVVIENGTVRVKDSPCRDKLCVFSGTLNKAGEWTACLPNKVFIKLVGKGEEEVDEVSY